MTDCCICYEELIYTTDAIEFKQLHFEYLERNKHMEKHKTIMNFINLSIHNSQTCENEKCKSIVCGNCWTKILLNGKELLDATDEDQPNNHDLYKCPLCRQVYWKYHMKQNVHCELIMKVLKGEAVFELVEMMKRSNKSFKKQ
jgi:uncharacterized protein with PIN domain